MSKILCIETATDICSVSLSHDGKTIALAETAKGFSHASTLTILIQNCLDETNLTLNELDAVALSQGPGSYTGLRIGVSVAKGICYALDKPMIAIDTLEALAWACAEEEKQDTHYCPMVDARRMEVYTAMYNLKGEEEQSVNALIVEENAFEAIFSKEETIIFCGNGSEKCQPILTSPFAKFSPIICSAKHLSFLAKKYFDEGNFCDVAYFSPLYYKSPNITIPRKNL
ncbi:MAG: tRNA threonylcarbamoyladenosine biosynthesis protein TsaB [Granulosicoccus sp.]|jgi:tRNA threonylcarbamoyladenosine biosynthesis protein TsaB